jgi:serine protease AprX
MFNRVLGLLVLLTLTAGTQAQSFYWVQLKDKLGSPFSVERPHEFLSYKSIARRVRQDILVNGTDLPINPSYREQVLNIPGVKLHHASKWLNGLCVEADSSAVQSLATLDCVKELELLYTPLDGKNSGLRVPHKFEDDSLSIPVDYGFAAGQIDNYNLRPLHDRGFFGKGLWIGVFDSGFNLVDEIDHFDHLRAEGRIQGRYDFVDKDHSDLGVHNHGRLVLSTMAAVADGEIIGAAPNATYTLFRTENASSERKMEEINWVAAAEMADSLGIDIFNTSLGYTRYYNDTGGVDSSQSWTWEDLDGNTSFITRGADLAAQKGILVVNSAGNSGHGWDPWQYIGMPADGDSVLAVGAVDSSQWRSGFSSKGRGADPRVKPNVMAQGSWVYVSGLDSNGNSMVGFNFGTSFSSPLTAGAAACLWEMNRSMSAWEIKTLIERSSSQYNSPDTLHGYGIPNFEKAAELMLNEKSPIADINIYPNPATTYLNLEFFMPVEGEVQLDLVDLAGRLQFSRSFPASKGNNIELLHLSRNLSGMYILNFRSEHFRTSELIEFQARD